MNRKILIVDDEPNVLVGYSRNMGDKFEITAVTSAEDAIKHLQSASFAVILSDLRMPMISGTELLKRSKEVSPDTVRMMISGNADLESAVEVVNTGSIFRILAKPCHHTVLAVALEDAIRQHQLITAERELLDQTLNGSIQVIVDILGMIDSAAFGKASLRREISKIVANNMGLQSVWDIEIAALLADIGRVTLPPEVMKKHKWREEMNAFEKDLWTQLPEMSSKLLSHIPRLEDVAKIVLYQNKNFNGSGFPSNEVAGELIPIGARILRAINTFLDIKQEEISLQKVLEKLENDVAYLDSNVVQAIKNSIEQIKNISVPQVTASSRQVMVKDLQPGQTLCSNVKATDGLVIMAAGQKLQPAHIQKIKNFANLMGIQQPIEVLDSFKRVE